MTDISMYYTCDDYHIRVLDIIDQCKRQISHQYYSVISECLCFALFCKNSHIMCVPISIILAHPNEIERCMYPNCSHPN
jgi:hypothetical protein